LPDFGSIGESFVRGTAGTLVGDWGDMASYGWLGTYSNGMFAYDYLSRTHANDVTVRGCSLSNHIDYYDISFINTDTFPITALL
jgi:hypothetical protein